MYYKITYTRESRLTWLVLSEGHHYEITALHLTLITHQCKKYRASKPRFYLSAFKLLPPPILIQTVEVLRNCSKLQHLSNDSWYYLVCKMIMIGYKEIKSRSIHCVSKNSSCCTLA